MKNKKPYIDRPLVDKLADANAKETVRKIRAERPKTDTLTDQVKQVLGK